MSEYQYYEFQAIDRPLTREEMDELRRYSTRAEITPSRFWNEYSWGSFKGDPRRWMERYFDAFLYLANWGSHWFMLRLPRTLIDLRDISEYLLEDGIEGWQTQEHVVLSFRSETEDPDWEEGAGWLPSLLSVRASLMRGDHRSLYLGWLAAAWAGNLDDDASEPLVPPGLAELDAAHRALADFLRIPADLVAAAAESSARLQSFAIGPDAIAGWLAQRPAAEKDALLLELLVDERPHQLTALRQRIEQDLTPAATDAVTGQRRTVVDLRERAKALIQERAARMAAEAAERRERHLTALRGREDELWDKVGSIATRRHASAYDEILDLLLDLRDLAMRAGATKIFAARLQRFRVRNSRKAALIRRLDAAGLSG